MRRADNHHRRLRHLQKKRKAGSVSRAWQENASYNPYRQRRKLIRSHLCSAIPKDRLIQLYIPKIQGKEKRKAEPSAEGTLGVEGMERKLLFDLLAPFEDESAYLSARENKLSKADMYADGLSGREDSSVRRAAVCKRLGLPEDMTANALLEAMRILITYEEYCDIVGRNSK